MIKNKAFIFNIETSAASLIRNDTIDDIEYMVLPVVAAKETVMNDIFYPADEFSEWLETWEGIPVPVNHPKVNNQFVSAKSIAVHESNNIGIFHNVTFEDGKLKGEMWIDKNKASKIKRNDVIETLEKGEVMETSICVFGDLEETKGEFNGIPYSGVIRHMRPDHVALLPNAVGACSIENGCGALRTNSKEETCTCLGGEKPCECPNENTGIKASVLSALRLVGSKLGFINQDSYEKITMKLHDMINTDERSYNWVIDTYDTYFIYSDEKNNMLYKQNYSVLEDEIILGEKVEVEREVEYIVVNEKKGDDKLEKKEVISNIIANSKTKFEESDRELLSTFEESLLEKMVVNETTEEVKEEKTLNEKVSDLLANIEDAEIKEILTNALDKQKEEKAELISDIMANSELVESDLEMLGVEQLKKVVSACSKKTQPTFEGRGAGNAPAVNETKEYKSIPISELYKGDK